MFQIEGLTEEPKQRYKLPIENSGIEADLSLYWRDTQNSWYFDLSYDDFSVREMRLCFMPNILLQFANRIPFGLLVETKTYQDPMTINTFIDGTTTLYILNQTEVQELEAEYG
jgi:hypothetical protein